MSTNLNFKIGRKKKRAGDICKRTLDFDVGAMLGNG